MFEIFGGILGGALGGIFRLAPEVLKFCENFQVYLYEVPGEDFNEYAGIEKAKSLGYKGVVLSSLS